MPLTRRQPTPLMGFRSLQHMPAERIHWSRALPRPLRSAFRVWLPSWRFAPLTAWPGLFHPDSARGIRPFGAFSSHEVAIAFPRPLNPHAVSPARSPTGEPAGRNAEHRLPGFHPRESPWLANGCLARGELDAPLGFPLPGHCHRTLCRASTRTPLTRLAECSSANCSTTRALGSRSASDWPDLATSASQRERPNSPLRVFVPIDSRRWRRSRPWLMNSPRR
jgi:hypothetical protein